MQQLWHKVFDMMKVNTFNVVMNQQVFSVINRGVVHKSNAKNFPWFPDVAVHEKLDLIAKSLNTQKLT